MVKLISSFPSQRKLRVSVGGEMSAPREMQAGTLQGSVLSPTLYSMYINDIPHTAGVYLAVFADDTYMYATDRKEVYVVRRLQRSLNSIETWCERWNIKINKDEIRAVCLCHKLRPPEVTLALNGWSIPFVIHVKYLDVIFHKGITWSLQREMIEAAAFRTFITV
jgi:hypothetical protein